MPEPMDTAPLEAVASTPQRSEIDLLAGHERPIVVVGANGQLGRALLAHPEIGTSGAPVAGWNRDAFDLESPDAMRATLDQARPALVLLAAAWTAVDRAESEPERAWRANAEAPGEIAAWCHANEARLVHISTDFVFDGDRSTAWPVDAPMAPKSVYGASKKAGEEAVLAACPGAVVVRTSWVHSANGTNFVRSILRRLRDVGSAHVVDDQIGAPTSATGLASAVLAFASHPTLCGRVHYRDLGIASWYDVAQAIAEEATRLGWFVAVPEVVPIPSSAWPAPAARPAFSALDVRTTMEAFPQLFLHWRVRLREELRALGPAGFRAL